MGHTIRPADLQAMTPREQETVLSAFTECATGPANGQVTAALGRIRAFEKQYEMRSDELLTRLGRKEIRETKEIASWLFWLGVVQARGGR